MATLDEPDLGRLDRLMVDGGVDEIYNFIGELHLKPRTASFNELLTMQILCSSLDHGNVEVFEQFFDCSHLYSGSFLSRVGLAGEPKRDFCKVMQSVEVILNSKHCSQLGIS